jgi:hypothetical protein
MVLRGRGIDFNASGSALGARDVVERSRCPCCGGRASRFRLAEAPAFGEVKLIVVPGRG